MECSPPQLHFSSNVKNMDEWANRTSIPLTSADALGTNYARAHRWLLQLKAQLVQQHGWVDVSSSDPRMLFTIQCESPYRSTNGLPRGPVMRLQVPLHASSFFSPERRVQWEMVFHGSLFPALRHTVPAIADTLHLLQCLLTGMIVLIHEENVAGDALYKTFRALPSADWITAHQAQLTEVFGASHYKTLFKAANDKKKAFRLEKHPAADRR